MLNRKELDDYISSKAYEMSDDTKLCQSISCYANDKYNIPKSVITDCLCGRKDLSEFSDYALYCTYKAIEFHIKNLRPASDFFTEIELKSYEEQKYINPDKITYPLRFDNVIQVNDSQWIGKITVNQLMKLKNNQMINYNKNTQRSLRRVIDNGVEHYKIFVNKKAIKKISECYNDGTYIPSTITLNLTESADFYYNDDEKELIINSFDGFDILDGYHRYLAISNIYMLNSDFDYDMELRLVCFSEDKCQQFIFQEDQKTKMKKIDSDALNQNSHSNLITKRLNDDALFNLKGTINRDDGLINFADLSLLIDYFYGKRINKSDNKRKEMIDVSKELRTKFNILSESDNKYFDERYTYELLLSIIYVFSSDIDSNDIVEMVELLHDYVLTLDKKVISKPPKKKIINAIKDFMED